MSVATPNPAEAVAADEQRDESMVLLGQIGAPLGVQGWNRLRVFADDPLSWLKMPVWWVATDSHAPLSGWREVTDKSLRVHHHGYVLRLEDCGDRDQAAAWQSWFVAAPLSALPKAAADEYYWGELVGMRVLLHDGSLLGTVSSLMATGANDVLEVRDEAGKVHLLPFVASVVGKIDRAARTIEADWQADW